MPVLESNTNTAGDGRYHELDALRGLAALTVVFYHFSLLLSQKMLDHLETSPIKLLVSGYPAVILFFFLSGFVLSLPYLRGKPPIYREFLIKRICRIYVPYLAALGLSSLGDFYFHHIPYPNSWANLTWSRPLALSLFVQHIGLIGDFDWFQINTAFWSLVYEMRISFFFPLIASLIVRFRSRWLLISAGIMSISVSALVLLVVRLTSPGNIYYAFNYLVTLHYAALFIVGAVVAKERQRLTFWRASLGTTSRACLTIAGVALYVYSQNLQAIIHFHYPRYISSWGTVAGASIIVLTALTSPRAGKLLRSRPLVHLGEISYSLYLVHGTVLFSLMHFFYGRQSLLLIFPIYIVLTLVFTALFHRYVERPAMLLGKTLASKA